MTEGPAISIALDRCRIGRLVGGAVEVVEADPDHRAFPDRVTASLGVCLKRGGDHDVRADGRRLCYPADAICVRPPGCVWSTDGTGPVGFLSIDIDAAALPDGGLGGRMRFARASELDSLPRFVAALRGASEPLEQQTLVASLVNTLLDRELVCARDLGAPLAPSSVARARALLMETLADPPALEALAEAVGANRFVLLREFRRAFGLPPHAFVLRARIESSRALLARGAEVADVAHRLGFSDQSHFTRVFKRNLGITPAAYQRQARRTVARI